MMIALRQVRTLRELSPVNAFPEASDADMLSALQKLCPRVKLEATADAVTVRGARGSKRLAYPFMNDKFFLAAAEL